MKKIVGSVLFLFSLCAVPLYAMSHTPASRSSEVVIRVTAATPGVESKFDCAYLFDANGSPLEHEEHATPYEIRGRGRLVSAIFRKAVGSPDIKVSVTTVEPGSKEQFHGSGEAAIVALGTDPRAIDKIWLQAIDAE